MTSLTAQAIKESLQQAKIKLTAIPQIKVIQLNKSNHTANSDNHEASTKESD